VKKTLSFLIALSLIFSVAAFVFSEDEVAKKVKYIYVDPSAADGGIGTMERPFRTLAEARDSLRPMLPKLPLPEGGIHVVLAEGEYRFNETFTFISDDSGKDGRYVTYKGDGDVYFIGGGEGTVLNGSIIGADDVNYLAFENIKFKDNFNAPLINFVGNNVTFKNCTFSDSAFSPSTANKSNAYAVCGIGDGIAVEGCEFYNVEGAVSIVGSEKYSEEAPKTRIHNNYIHDVGLSGITNIPAVSLVCNGGEISHNEIKHAVTDPIVLCGSSNSVAYNRLTSENPGSTNNAIVTTGGFFSYGNSFKYNFIDSFGGVGINLTEGVSGSVIHGNIIKDTYRGIYLGGGRNTKITGNIVINTGNFTDYAVLCDSSLRESVIKLYKAGENVTDSAFTEKLTLLSEKYPIINEFIYSLDIEDKPPFSDPDWYFNPAENEVSDNAFYVGKDSSALSVVTDGELSDGMPYHVRYGSFYSNVMMPRGDFSDFPKMQWNNFDLSENAVLFTVLCDFEAIPFTEIGRLGQKPQMYFTDITENDWFFPSVSYAFDNALMSGTNKDGTVFSPYTVTTRAMLVQMLYNLEGNPEAEYSDIFTDVKESDWCAPAIMWAYKNGITTGTGDGRFDPNASVTREQIAVFLYRFISEYKREPQEISGNLDAFTDKDDVSPYAGFAEAVTWAVDSGLISGKNEFGVIRLAPRDVAQRCETAAVIARFHEGFVK